MTAQPFAVRVIQWRIIGQSQGVTLPDADLPPFTDDVVFLQRAAAVSPRATRVSRSLSKQGEPDGSRGRRRKRHRRAGITTR